MNRVGRIVLGTTATAALALTGAFAPAMAADREHHNRDNDPSVRIVQVRDSDDEVKVKVRYTCDSDDEGTLKAIVGQDGEKWSEDIEADCDGKWHTDRIKVEVDDDDFDDKDSYRVTVRLKDGDGDKDSATVRVGGHRHKN